MATKGVKKGSTISFYTQKEIEIIERVAKNGKKGKENIVHLSKLLGRPATGIGSKYLAIRKKLGIARKHIRTSEGTTKTVHLSKEMKLQFPAKSVVVENNRIIVYFK